MLIKNAKLLEKGKAVVRDILIKKGKIISINKSISLKSKNNKKNKEVIIDAKHNLVLPGLIDPHVHCRDPGFTHKENLKTASKAALAGGVTTMIDMPNTAPATFTIKALNQKKKLAKKALNNVLFHFGTNGQNMAEIKKAEKRKDVASTKLYMNLTTGKNIVEGKETLENIFKTSKFLTLHAEGKQLDQALALAIKYKRKIYICHVYSKKAMQKIEKAKKKHKQIYTEVCPHHLYLNKLHKKKLKGFALMKPELETKADNLYLWKALKNNKINTIATDHAPHLKKEKQTKAPPFGVPSIEMRLPLMLDAVNKHKLTLTQLVRFCSTNPAKIFNIKNKGKVAKGYDADLVIVDMNKLKIAKNKDQHTKCKWTPYNGMKLKGWPIMTILNGKVLWKAK